MRAAAGAISRERARARAHLEIAVDHFAVLISFGIRARDRDVAAVLAALKVEVARRRPMRCARGCSASTLVSCVLRADRPALTTRRAVHVTNAITVWRGQCMLVVLAQVCSGELFIDRARVARIRSCTVQGVRKAAQVAGDRIIGRGRGMRRHRRGPREKELQDQRACHLGHARPGCPN